MKKETKEQIKNDMKSQLALFNNLLYGCKRPIDSKMKEAFSKINDMVDIMDSENVDDFDLWVFITYRLGKMRSKNVCIKHIEPKTLIQAIDEGFTIPDETTLVKIEIRPVIKNDYDVRVVPENVYDVRFGLGKEENLTALQLKRRYGLEANENLFSIQDLQEGNIFKFYKRKNKQRAVSVRVGV